MPDSDDKPDQRIRILNTDDEEARKVAKAIASPTASEILGFMGNREVTSSDIADALTLPLNTIHYHLGNLLDAGIIEIPRIKYSVKGREVRVFRQKNQLLIVAPKQTEIKELLIKYASLFGVISFGTIILLISRMIQAGTEVIPMPAPKFYAAIANSPQNFEVSQDIAMGSGGMNENFILRPDIITPEVILAFFFGGMIIILVLLAQDILRERKTRKNRSADMGDENQSGEITD